MKDIVIIANYCRDFSENDNGRFMYLCKKLSQENYVEIITSDFVHGENRHKEPLATEWPFKITFLHEPGYPKNVCMQRLYSHVIWGKNVRRYLRERKVPDVVYCAVPSLTAPLEAAKYCRENSVRFIIDIQDLWPEAFKMVFNVPVISDVLFWPMKHRADRIYGAADEIVAVSKTYAERAMRVNKKCKSANVVFLGTEKETFDEYADSEAPEMDHFTVAYIGNMSESYDLIPVIDALANIVEHPVKLLAMGDGERRKVFELYANKKGVNTEFTGRLPYPQMVRCLTECDVAVNPICKGAAQSIINKVGDYAMAGLPVVNTQECAEYRELLEQYQAGINCECGSATQVRDAIVELYEDEERREKMSANSRKLGMERFDRGRTYGKIVEVMMGNSSGGGENSCL